MKKVLRIIGLPFWFFWKVFTIGASLLAAAAFITVVTLIVTALYHKPVITIPDNAVYLLAPKGAIVEQRSAIDPFSRMMNGLAGLPIHQDTFLQDILDTINTAATDPRIRALVLDTDRLERITLDQSQAIGESLELFKQTGKRVIARGNSFNQGQYYLASWADEISLHPMGRVGVKGFGVFQLYLAEFLNKTNIDFHVFRVGTYKSAVEPLIRTDMSEAAKSANKLWLDKLWMNYCGTVAHNRQQSVTKIQAYSDNLTARLEAAGGDQALMALNNGLVDQVETDEQFRTRIIEQGATSASNNTGYRYVTLEQYLQVTEPAYTTTSHPEGSIGIISVSGNILYGENIMDQIGSEDLIKQIRLANQNADIKGLVLRITTGGGSAFASERIRQELLAFQRTGRPVVVSMGAVTASGGYWLAADADAIFAAPTTLTGSIGIFGAIPTVDRAMNALGIYGDGTATTRNADYGNPVTPMSETEQQFFQLSVESGYKQFLDIVSKGRDMSLQEVEKIAEGHVWDGATALELGLVDTLGNLQDAIAEAARRADIPAENGMYITSPNAGLQNFLQKLGGSATTYLTQRLTLTAPALFLPLQQAHSTLQALDSDPNGLYGHAWLPADIEQL